MATKPNDVGKVLLLQEHSHKVHAVVSGAAAVAVNRAVSLALAHHMDTLTPEDRNWLLEFNQKWADLS